MFELMVEDTFSAAHQLKGYKGRCENLHGHTFKVQIFIEGEKLKPEGYLIDFQDLKAALKKVLDELDHSYLNDLPYFKELNPTAESLAKLIYEKMRPLVSDLKKVTVWESASASASYRP